MANLRFRRPWDFIPESAVTPEDRYLNRRQLLKSLGIGSIGLGAAVASFGQVNSASDDGGPYGNVPRFWIEKWADLFPAKHNDQFKVDYPLTDEKLFAAYNNFYEFSFEKHLVKDFVGGFEANPWEIEIKGKVEKPGRYDLDDLIRIAPLEERIYHHRCVEAWSANVPWTGFPLRKLIEHVQPDDKVKYVRFVTLLRPSQMPGQRNSPYPWPYYEALSIEEAMNEVALLTFGIYGHPLNKQNGAPVRMVLPWKYGFKGIKSIVKIEFLSKRPGTFWSDILQEYGFWGNTNPAYDHPRWSQGSEIFLNTNEWIPTKIYNGYGDFVGHLYDEAKREYFF